MIDLTSNQTLINEWASDTESHLGLCCFKNCVLFAGSTFLHNYSGRANYSGLTLHCSSVFSSSDTSPLIQILNYSLQHVGGWDCCDCSRWKAERGWEWGWRWQRDVIVRVNTLTKCTSMSRSIICFKHKMYLNPGKTEEAACWVCYRTSRGKCKLCKMRKKKTPSFPSLLRDTWSSPSASPSLSFVDSSDTNSGCAFNCSQVAYSLFNDCLTSCKEALHYRMAQQTGVRTGSVLRTRGDSRFDHAEIRTASALCPCTLWVHAQLCVCVCVCEQNYPQHMHKHITEFSLCLTNALCWWCVWCTAPGLIVTHILKPL